MDLAIIFDLIITFGLNHCAIFQGKFVCCIGQVFLFNQNTLECLGVEAEGGATFQTLFIGIEIDVLELFVIKVGRYVGCF